MRDVAVVAVAQTNHLRESAEINEVELIQPVIHEVFDQVGATAQDMDFTCSGSSDYFAGQAFSFVMTLDAVGAWPPINESHVEMDGAWALYEAWVKIQTGHADTALVYSYSKASPGDLPKVLTRTLDPYYLAPLWPDSIALAGLQAREMIERGVTTKDEMAAIAERSRRDAQSNPHAQLKGSAGVNELLEAAPTFDPLHVHDCPPISDGGVAVILAAGDKAREWAERPAWLRGIDHRVDSHQLGSRDLTTAPSVGTAGRNAGVVDGRLDGRPFDVAELHACFTHHEVILRNELGLAGDVTINPSGGPLAANPVMAAGLLRIGEVANRIMSGDIDRGVAHATGGQLLQQNLVATLEGE